MGRPPSSDGAQTRREILIAARRSFAERGFAVTTMKDVAEPAGLTTGAVHYHFGSKQRLYEEVYEEVTAIIFGRLAALFADATSLRGAMTEMLRECETIGRQEASLAAFYIAIASETRFNDELHDIGKRQVEGTREFFGRLVDLAVQRGELAETESVGVAEMLAAVTNGLARYSVLTDEGASENMFIAARALFSGDLSPFQPGPPEDARRPRQP